MGAAIPEKRCRGGVMPNRKEEGTFKNDEMTERRGKGTNWGILRVVGLILGHMR